MNTAEKMKVPDKVNDVVKNSGIHNAFPLGPEFSPLYHNYVYFCYVEYLHSYMGKL